MDLSKADRDFPKAERLNKLPPYLFAALRQKMAAVREKGVKVITLGIGDPDQPTPDPIIDELVRAVRDVADPNRHRYGCDVAFEGYVQSVKAYYKERFNVALEDKQIVATTGSKDAIVQFCMGVMNPGDVGIAPDPGYPTYNIGHIFASGATHYLPLRQQNGWLPDFTEIPREVKRLAKIMWLNYPNNPTTATATLDFYKRAVEFARQNNIILCSDAAYLENTYGDYRAPSILQVEGASEVAVEFFSLSKAFNMTGWRVGFVVGNASAVNALRLVKDNVDNGTLRPVQFAAAKALSLTSTLVPKIMSVYEKRRDMVVDALNANGWALEKPKGTIYVWAPVPKSFSSSAAFAESLLEKTGVAITPGAGYGQHGEGFFRISLSYPDATLKEAIGRIMDFKV